MMTICYSWNDDHNDDQSVIPITLMMNISSFILKILELLQAASFHRKNLPKQDRSPGPYHKLWHSWLASTSIWRRIPLELGSSAEDERLGSMPSLEVWLVQIIFLYSKWVVCIGCRFHVNLAGCTNSLKGTAYFAENQWLESMRTGLFSGVKCSFQGG